MLKRPPINNQIRAAKVRLIDETGQQMGILTLEEALRVAKERNSDLIQVTEKIDPPVCKLMDYGKYLYREKRKEKTITSKTHGGLKGVRFGLKISQHDLETKANAAGNFLKKGYKIKLELVLRGREKALADFAKEKMNHFIETLDKIIPIKTEKEIKKGPNGFSAIILKK